MNLLGRLVGELGFIARLRPSGHRPDPGRCSVTARTKTVLGLVDAAKMLLGGVLTIEAVVQVERDPGRAIGSETRTEVTWPDWVPAFLRRQPPAETACTSDERPVAPDLR